MDDFGNKDKQELIDALLGKANQLHEAYVKLKEFVENQNMVIKTQQETIVRYKAALTKLKVTADFQQVQIINDVMPSAPKASDFMSMFDDDTKEKIKDVGIEVFENPWG